MCYCGSLLGDSCGTGLPSDFYNLFDEDGNKIDSFKRKHFSYLKNIYLNENNDNFRSKKYDNIYEIEDNKNKIYINQNDFVELTLTENPIIKKNYITIEDTQILRNFPVKEFTGQEILYIIYNNSKQFIKSVGGYERKLDIIIWKKWCDRIYPNEWYSRLFINKNYLQIESNKKSYILSFQDKKLTSKVSTWGDFNRNDLVKYINLNINSLESNINLEEEKITSFSSSFSCKPIIKFNNEFNDIFIENLILGNEDLSDLEKTQYKIYFTRYKIDKSKIIKKLYLSDDSIELIYKYLGFYELINEIKNLKDKYNYFKEEKKKLINNNSLILKTLSSNKTYQVKLKDNITFYIADFKEYIYDVNNQEDNKLNFIIKAYKPTPVESPRFIINCGYIRSFDCN